MQDFDLTFNKNSKQFLNLTNTLKNNVSTKLLEDLSLKLKPQLESTCGDKCYHNFKPHPQRFFSDSDMSLQSSKQDLVVFNCRSIMKPIRSCSENSVSNCFSMGSPRETEATKSNTDSRPLKERSDEKAIGRKLLNKDDVNKSERISDFDVGKSIIRNRQKVIHTLQKILFCFGDIRIPSDVDIEPPDGTEDLDRLRKRTIEFSSRFARNYLYSLERQMNLLHKATRCTKKIGQRAVLNIELNLLAAHRTVLQALKIFQAHLVSCIVNVVVDKLKYLLEQINILCRIHSKCLNLLNVDSEECKTLIRDVESTSLTLLNKIWEMVHNRSQINADSNTKISPGALNLKQSKKNSKLKTRLSMYSVSSPTKNKDLWKKAVNTLSRHKFRYGHIQSRYKSVGYKEKNMDEKLKIDVTSKSKTLKSSTNLKHTPISTLCNEDDIQTMVEFHKEKSEQAITNCVPTSSSSLDTSARALYCEKTSENLPPLVSILQELCQQFSKPTNQAVSQQSLETLLKGFLEMARDEKINTKQEFVLENAVDSQNQINLANGTRDCKNRSSDKKHDFKGSEIISDSSQTNKLKIVENNSLYKNGQIVSVVGAKNAQLICIKTRDNNTPNMKVSDNANTQSQKCTKNKINRVPKRVLRKLTIPKTEACAAISYKFQYCQYTKGNTMYTKSSVQQPWVIIDFLSERLLEDLIMSVTKEIQVEDLIQNLYEAEFL